MHINMYWFYSVYINICDMSDMCMSIYIYTYRYWPANYDPVCTYSSCNHAHTITRMSTDEEPNMTTECRTTSAISGSTQHSLHENTRALLRFPTEWAASLLAPLIFSCRSHIETSLPLWFVHMSSHSAWMDALTLYSSLRCLGFSVFSLSN